MTDKNMTEIIAIVDRSGSMEAIAPAMQRGFANFIAKQVEVPGTCFVSLYQFDDAYEVVYEGRSARHCGNLALVPRGNTALLDAVGKTIVATGERLARLPESVRPGVVVVLIVTDGHENASKEYNYARVREMIKHQQEKYNWQFAYLGSDLSTPLEAARIGTQSYSYNATPSGVQQMYACVGQSIGLLRAAVASGDLNAQLQVEDEASASS